MAASEVHWIWKDGEFARETQSTAPAVEHFSYPAVEVGEDIRSYQQDHGGAALFRLEDHLQRLWEACSLLGMRLPYSRTQLEEVCIEMIRRHHWTNAYVRVLISGQSQSSGIVIAHSTPRVNITTRKWDHSIKKGMVREGIRARTCLFSGKTSHPYRISIKKSSGFDNYEARLKGQEEVIFFDGAGDITGTTTENVFFVRNGVVTTPPAGALVSCGITRDTVLKLSYQLGYPLQEERFTREKLYAAEEVFLTGTAAEITPVREIDGRLIGAGRPGPITQTLQTVYCATVQGRRDATYVWLTPVPEETNQDVHNVAIAQ